MSASTFCAFVIPGDWLTPTGGYRYDRRIVLALREAGWTVEHVPLNGTFPSADAQALDEADRRLQALPDGAATIVDGLAFGAMPDVAARHAQRLRLVALVHHPLHLETGLGPAQQAAYRAGEARALVHARLVVVTSESTALDVVAMGVERRRIAVVEPGVDAPAAHPELVSDDAGDPARSGAAARYATAGLRADEPDAVLRLLCVATLVPRKGHAVLLRALAGLCDLPWSLCCVGSATRDEATSRALLALTADLGLTRRVHWAGEVGETQLPGLYGRSDVFVLPSFHEGYGMVITEALSYGLPIVTTTGGALSQTLPEGVGLRVPPGDVQALQGALRRLMTDTALRAALAGRARAHAATLTTWAQSAARFAQAIEGIE